MPRKESEAVPEGNGSVPQQEEFGSNQPTLADVYRTIEMRAERKHKINCFSGGILKKGPESDSIFL